MTSEEEKRITLNKRLIKSKRYQSDFPTLETLTSPPVELVQPRD